MTTTDPNRPTRRRKLSPRAVFTGSIALFVAVFGYLTLQLAQGVDQVPGSDPGSGLRVTQQDAGEAAPSGGYDQGLSDEDPSDPVVTASS